MVFSKKKRDLSLLAPVYLNGETVEYVHSIKCTNSILNVLQKPSEEVSMQLLNTNCVPILTYASAVKVFSAKEMTMCTVALNDAIQKIVTFNRWESVRSLRENFGYKSLYDIFAIASRKFRETILSHCNSILKSLAEIVSNQ